MRRPASARFNVETPADDDHLHFSGLPSPAAAGSIAGFAILFYTLRRETNTISNANLHWIDSIMQVWLCIFALAIGALMVSRIPYPHIVNQMFRGQCSFGHIVGVVFSLVAIMVVRGYSIPILCCAFVLGPPAKFLWQRLHQRTRRKRAAVLNRFPRCKARAGASRAAIACEFNVPNLDCRDCSPDSLRIWPA